ncbi:MAG: PAS domain S-box protein [Magnetococcales bacterium]|nr:PAS domain S-box protein [Magnetococcales bacterium]
MTQHTEKPVILVIDDEIGIIKILVDFLKEDYKLLIARDGQSALKIALSNSIDLILLDIVMPEMDGFEVFRQLRAKSNNHNTPVIFISGNDQTFDEAKGLELGAVDYISKPLSYAILKARVKNHIELSKYRNHLEQTVRQHTDKIAESLTTIKQREKSLREAFTEKELLLKEIQNKSADLSLMLDETDKEKQFSQLLLNTVDSGIIGIDLLGLVNFANPKALLMLGWSGEELVGRQLHLFTCARVPGSEFLPSKRCPICGYLNNDSETSSEYIFHHRSGKPFYVNLSVKTMFHDNEKIGRVVIFTDITAQKKMEQNSLEIFQKLQTNEKQLDDIINNTPALIFLKDTKGRFLRINRRYEELFHISRDGIKGQTDLDIFSTEIAEKLQSNDQKVLESGHSMEFEEEVLQDDGIHYYISVKFPIFDTEDKIYAICGIATDITKRKRVEEDLQISNKDKEILLQEVHHRVKNNLQIISSLLQLQAKDLQKKKPSKNAAIEAIIESRNRVASMALIHERLYSSSNLAQINFRGYVTNLLQDMLSSFTVAHGDIHSDVIMEDIELSIDQAIPCGLIINELVSNSLKHAFAKANQGKITIDGKMLPQQMIELTVKDNGVGLAKDFNLEQSKSLGLSLIYRLAQQLAGKITIDSTNGCVVCLRFKRS